MLAYFDDKSLSVIQIRNQIVYSHLDFAISMFKRYKSNYMLFRESDSTAIKKLLKYVY
jgi:hypothetical protein